MINAGVVDADYRGEIMILMHNLSPQPFTFHEGDRVAQLVLEKIAECNAILANELPESTRGNGGFGSSGLKSVGGGYATANCNDHIDSHFQERHLSQIVGGGRAAAVRGPSAALFEAGGTNAGYGVPDFRIKKRAHQKTRGISSQ